MKSRKSLYSALLLASALVVSPLSSAHAAPAKGVADVPAPEKSASVSWAALLVGLWQAVWGDEGCSIDSNGLCLVHPGAGDETDHGMSIDPNGGR